METCRRRSCRNSIRNTTPPTVTSHLPLPSRQVTTSTGTTKTLNAPINFRQHHRRQPTLCRYRYQEHPRRRRKTASLPQDRVMTMRLVQTPSASCLGLVTPVVEAVLRSARQRAEWPCHLTNIASQPGAASRPPLAASLGSIAIRPRMRLISSMEARNRAMSGQLDGSRTFVEADELQAIRPQAIHAMGRGAARATPTIRKRQHEEMNVSKLTQRHIDKCELADRLRITAELAAKRVLRKTHWIEQLEHLLTVERFEASKARKRATALEKASNKSAAALQLACFQAGLARNALACGWSAREELEDKDLDAKVREAQAARDAASTKKMAEEALRVADQRDAELKIYSKLYERAEAAHDDAEVLSFRCKKKASRAEARVVESSEAGHVGRKVAAVLVAMRAGAGVEGSNSSCDDEQEEPKTKRARR